MKRFEGYLKVIPVIETEEKHYPTDDEVVDVLVDLSMDISSWIGFEEVTK